MLTFYCFLDVVVLFLRYHSSVHFLSHSVPHLVFIVSEALLSIAVL